MNGFSDTQSYTTDGFSTMSAIPAGEIVFPFPSLFIYFCLTMTEAS